MKKRNRSTLSVAGAIAFFALVAIVMQIAILVFNYIEERTTNKALIAVLVLILILILSAVCTVIDYIRRKIMVDKPVKKILEATEKITSGDFSVRIESEHKYSQYNVFENHFPNQILQFFLFSQ